MIGVVTNRRIGKNRDGSADKVILQLEIIKGEDVRTVELFSQSGEDVNPANGCRANIISIIDSYLLAVGISDDLMPECEPGERELYSTDNPVTLKKARLKLDKNSHVVINQGTNFAVKYNELKTAFEELKKKFDEHTHPYVDTPVGASTTSATTTPSTADITTTKSATVRIP